jgi:hypothetical protein
MKIFLRTALDAAIKEACGFVPEIQKTAQKYSIDIVAVIQELGFVCSLPNIATKKDIAFFLKVPESTLNFFLAKYSNEIKPLLLDQATIKTLGSKAHRLYGYQIEDVAKIAIGMDTPIGIEIKQRMFGDMGSFANIHNVKPETQWHRVFNRAFQGLGLHHNYPVDQYKVDFFVQDLMLRL